MATVSSTTTSTSTAATGGSVIDVNSLVSQLVAATRAPKDSLISTQTQTATTQISAIGTLKGALSAFQTSLAALDTPTAFNAQTASSSAASVFTASADSNATAGTYNISVTRLAQAQQLVSKPITGDATTVVGTGALQVSLGAASFTVTVASGKDSVAAIASAINGAVGNPGVTATVITGTDGAHLVLSSTVTGAANTIQVAETDGGTGLSALTYSAGSTTNYTENTPAQDAEFSISGIDHTSASNTVSDALTGVTLNLAGTTATGTGLGSTATLTVANDNSAITTNVGAFVTAYNALVGSIASLGSYDSTTGTAGPMLGDALLAGVQSSVRSTLYSIVNTGSSTYNSLASVGITTKSDGTLALNSTKLQNALNSAPGAVSALFSSANGVASKLNTQLDADLASGGSIDSRSKTLVKQENALTDETKQLDTQMAALTASLTQQYAALNTLLSSLQSQSAALTQQLSSLPVVQQKT
jgi:flagellar hook-associated protein 2